MGEGTLDLLFTVVIIGFVSLIFLAGANILLIHIKRQLESINTYLAAILGKR